MPKKNELPSPERLKEIKQRAHNWGIMAERIAVVYLFFKGYRVLKTRYKNPHGEIDVIAKKKDTIIFIEVKARKTKDLALEAVQPRQKLRIEKAAYVFIQSKPKYLEMNVRFDVVCCAPLKWPKHIEDAWRPLG